MDSSKKRIIGIIPSRYASTRFPGKPLVMICGKSMVQRVYLQAKSCKALDRVIVATDDDRIYKHVIDFGGEAMLTSSNHNTGTDRIEEVITQLESQGEIFDIAINIQGDEPFIQPSQIEKVISVFEIPGVDISTLVKVIENKEDISNPNVVKVVTSRQGKALYFSRSAIPFQRGVDSSRWHESGTFLKHIGIYGYTTSTLKELVKLGTSPLEQAESLEQLRWLYHGYNIYTQLTDIETVGIDSPDDLSKFVNNPC
jgi:3-deoxy-manno-octulosonate cytidylyltransferase (CMP-KDO synthetase)